MGNPSTLLNDKLQKMYNRWPQLKIVSKSDNQHLLNLLHKTVREYTHTTPFSEKLMNLFVDKTRTTTIGYTIYLETDWDEKSDSRKFRTLSHEEQHVFQYEVLGDGDANTKKAIKQYLTKYILLPLPIFKSDFRYKWERQAFLESLWANYLVYENKEKTLEKAKDYTQYLLSAKYLYPQLFAKKKTYNYFATHLYNRWK